MSSIIPVICYNYMRENNERMKRMREEDDKKRENSNKLNYNDNSYRKCALENYLKQKNIKESMREKEMLCKVLPIKFLVKLLERVILINKVKEENEKDKSKKKELKLATLMFESTLYYINKYCKKENLDTTEIEVNEDLINKFIKNTEE